MGTLPAIGAQASNGLGYPATRNSSYATIGFGNAAGCPAFYIDDIIYYQGGTGFDSRFTFPMGRQRIQRKLPVANPTNTYGATNQFTSSNASKANWQAALDSTDYVYTLVSAVYELYQIAPLDFTPNVITGIGVNYYGMNTLTNTAVSAVTKNSYPGQGGVQNYGTVGTTNTISNNINFAPFTSIVDTWANNGANQTTLIPWSYFNTTGFGVGLYKG
jgi:hypothetical protein